MRMSREIRIDSKARRIVGALVVIGVAYGMPAIMLWDAPWEKFEPGPMTIGIPVLYSIAVLGFVMLILGKNGVQVTSQETDKNISRSIEKILNPVWYAFVVAATVAMVYSLFLLWSGR